MDISATMLWSSSRHALMCSSLSNAHWIAAPYLEGGWWMQDSTFVGAAFLFANVNPDSVPWASVTGRNCLCRLFEYFAIITLINQVGITVFRAIAAIVRALCTVHASAFLEVTFIMCFVCAVVSSAGPPLLAAVYCSGPQLDLEHEDQQDIVLCFVGLLLR